MVITVVIIASMIISQIRLAPFPVSALTLQCYFFIHSPVLKLNKIIMIQMKLTALWLMTGSGCRLFSGSILTTLVLKYADNVCCYKGKYWRTLSF